MNKASVRVFLGILALVAVASIVGNIYLSRQVRALKQDPQQATQESVDKLLKEVSQLIFLPEGEIPNVVTVADPERLKDQPFFANAKVGDKLLIYTNARKAFLYNPTDKKLVEVAPLLINQDQPAAPSATATGTRR
jgi:hypothetical protein